MFSRNVFPIPHIIDSRQENRKNVHRIARLETNLKLLTSLTVSQFFLLVGVAVKTFLGA